MGDQKEIEMHFVLNIEGEVAISGPLLITEELMYCQMLEVVDFHFHHDSAVMLPTALPNLVCCYLYAMQWPSKLVLIAAHTDKSGPPLYNDWLSKKRAENVLNILLGERDKWVNSVTTEEGPTQRPDGKSKVEDYQVILAWAAKKYQWPPCDPRRHDKTNSKNWRRYARMSENIKALEAFQVEYEKKFHKKIEEDPCAKYKIGPKTWGAFFDLYMLELAELLGLYKVQQGRQVPDTSRLETYRNALKFVDGHKIVYGGETHARDSREHSMSDRRVHILFFDPSEKPKLNYHPFCHEPRPGNPPTLGEPERRPKDAHTREDKKRANKCEIYGKLGVYGKGILSCNLNQILYIEVLDRKDNPMSGVTVIVQDKKKPPPAAPFKKGRTNAKGVYMVPKMPEGTYIISVDTKNLQNPKGFEGVEKQVEVKYPKQ